jgi:hypothetical protein
MNPDLNIVIENAKEWIVDSITSSRCLCVGPCLFHFINAVPTATNASVTVKVYDGQNDQGTLKLHVHSQYSNPSCQFPEPCYCRRGLYVELGQNASGACIQYLPLRD